MHTNQIPYAKVKQSMHEVCNYVQQCTCRFMELTKFITNSLNSHHRFPDSYAGFFLTRLPSIYIKQELRWLRTRKPLAYRESTCTNLSVSCPYEIIVYSVLKHINTARMHTISRQFIPLIYRSLGKRILSKIQPILPFH